jgi:hypothetical protein
MPPILGAFFFRVVAFSLPLRFPIPFNHGVLPWPEHALPATARVSLV